MWTRATCGPFQSIAVSVVPMPLQAAGPASTISCSLLVGARDRLLDAR